RAPFELHPDAPFERIEMLVRAVALHALHELQFGLNAMEHTVKHYLLPYIGILLREHVQGKGEPPHAAPGDGAVRVTRKARWRPIWFRLAGGPRFSRWVKDHDRTTERHSPQPARVSL